MRKKILRLNIANDPIKNKIRLQKQAAVKHLRQYKRAVPLAA